MSAKNCRLRCIVDFTDDDLNEMVALIKSTVAKYDSEKKQLDVNDADVIKISWFLSYIVYTTQAKLYEKWVVIAKENGITVDKETDSTTSKKKYVQQSVVFVRVNKHVFVCVRGTDFGVQYSFLADFNADKDHSGPIYPHLYPKDGDLKMQVINDAIEEQKKIQKKEKSGNSKDVKESKRFGHSGFLNRALLLFRLVINYTRTRNTMAHKYVFCGHSLGAAVASLLAMFFNKVFHNNRRDQKASCCVIACPPFLDPKHAGIFLELVPQSRQTYSKKDPVVETLTYIGSNDMNPHETSKALEISDWTCVLPKQFYDPNATPYGTPKGSAESSRYGTPIGSPITSPKGSPKNDSISSYTEAVAEMTIKATSLPQERKNVLKKYTLATVSLLASQLSPPLWSQDEHIEMAVAMAETIQNASKMIQSTSKTYKRVIDVKTGLFYAHAIFSLPFPDRRKEILTSYSQKKMQCVDCSTRVSASSQSVRGGGEIGTVSQLSASMEDLTQEEKDVLVYAIINTIDILMFEDPVIVKEIIRSQAKINSASLHRVDRAHSSSSKSSTRKIKSAPASLMKLASVSPNLSPRPTTQKQNASKPPSTTQDVQDHNAVRVSVSLIPSTRTSAVVSKAASLKTSAHIPVSPAPALAAGGRPKKKI